MAKLDYCIIKIEKEGGKSSEIYIYAAPPNSKKLDKSVVNNQHFQELSHVLQENGFSLLDHMMFHISDKNSIKLKLSSLVSELDSRGFHRNEALEGTIKNNYKILKKFKVSKDAEVLVTKKYPQPKLGQKIDISFYLFIKPGEHDNEHLDLRLDYDISYVNSTSDHARFFVKVSNSKFVVKKISGDKIELESEKTFEDFVSELNMFYQITLIRDEKLGNPAITDDGGSGSQKFIDSIEIYNIMEVIDMISSKDKITINLSTEYDYQYLRNISKFLKQEKNKFDDESLAPLVLIKESALELINKFKMEIDDLCEDELYEIASNYQKYIKFLEKKIKYIDKLMEQGKENITGKEYHKHFCVKPLLG